MLLCQHDYFLPDNWQSDSCVKGLSILEDKGAKIYRPLYNEHLNKACKTTSSWTSWPKYIYTSHLSCFFKIPWDFST